MPFVSVPEAIEEIRAGRILVVVDDEDRENEGDLTIAAEKVTPEIINFMAVHGRGLICLALTPERCDYLRLPLMSPTNTSMFGTAFCESIDARDGVTTGISRRRSHPHHPAGHRSRVPCERPGASRPHVPAARARGRRAGARRTDRGQRGSGAAGRPHPGRRDLRNHERRRHHGARAATGGILQPPQPQDDFRGRPDPPPAEAREVHPARGRGLHPDRVRRLPHHRVRQRPESRVPPGAGARRRRRARRTCWCACTRAACSAMFSVPASCECARLVQNSLRAIARGGPGSAGVPARNRPRLPHRARWRRARRGCSATGATSCITRAKTASGSYSTSTASARRSSPTWACTRSAC